MYIRNPIIIRFDQENIRKRGKDRQRHPLSNVQGRIFVGLNQTKYALNMMQEVREFSGLSFQDPHLSQTWTQLSLLYQLRSISLAIVVDFAIHARGMEQYSLLLHFAK